MSLAPNHVTDLLRCWLLDTTALYPPDKAPLDRLAQRNLAVLAIVLRGLPITPMISIHSDSGSLTHKEMKIKITKALTLSLLLISAFTLVIPVHAETVPQIQVKGVNTSSLPGGVSFTANAALNHKLVVTIGDFNGLNTDTYSVSDSLGNIWIQEIIQDTPCVSGHGCVATIFDTVVASGKTGSSDTISVTIIGTNFAKVSASLFDLDTQYGTIQARSSGFDTGALGSTSLMSVSSVTPAQPGAVIVAFACQEQTLVDTSFAPQDAFAVGGYNGDRAGYGFSGSFPSKTTTLGIIPIAQASPAVCDGWSEVAAFYPESVTTVTSTVTVTSSGANEPEDEVDTSIGTAFVGVIPLLFVVGAYRVHRREKAKPGDN